MKGLDMHKLSIIFLSVLFLSVCGCYKPEPPPQFELQFQQPVLDNIISDQILEAAKLQLVWQKSIPVQTGEIPKKLTIIGDRVYLLTDRNYLVSMNRFNGNIGFSRSIGQPGFPVLQISRYKNEIYSIVGNELLQIDADSGDNISLKNYHYGIVCPAARNASYFYIAGSNRRIITYNAKNNVQVFQVAAEDDSQITSVLADENIVVFSTVSGNVIAITPDKPTKLWSFKAAEFVVEPMVRDGQGLFFANKDTCVYSLNVADGMLNWKFQAGAVLEKAPRVTSRTVYQFLGDKGLAAIHRLDGTLAWQLQHGSDLLSEFGGKIFIITKEGTIVVMDEKTASQLYSFNLAGVSVFGSNVTDSYIYIADNKGRIACLKPVEN